MNGTRRRFLRELSAGVGAAWALPRIASASPAATEAAASGRKLGYALVGLGQLSGGELAPALQRTKLAKLTGLVSGSPDKAREWAKKYGVPEKNIYNYENFDQIKNNPDIDIVYVVLPNSMHAEFTIRAAKAGKHVLCEKPMAVSVKECDEMIAACQAAGKQLAIGYRLHFEPYNMEMARLTREKVFGPVDIIETAAGFRIGDPTQWRLNKTLAGGGSLMDIGIYALQAARYISGEEPNAVSARMSITDPVKFKPGVDESMLLTLEFPSGALANCSSSYATGLARYWAGAERGWYELQPSFWYRGIRGRTRGPEGGAPKELQFPEVDQFALQMDDFAECVLTGKKSRVPGEEGRRDLRIMMAAYESAESGRRVAL